MKKVKIAYVLSLIIMGALNSHAQTRIEGKVTNTKKQPVAYASIAIKALNLGINTDSAGNFSMQVNSKGRQTIEASSVGYVPSEIMVDLNDSLIHLDFVLKNEPKALGEVVVISAGSFEASDKAKGASLSPMDAVTVAGTGGDLANSLRFLPGAQQVGDKEGLFVRGGTSEETKQFVDGALLPYPNYSSVPGIPQPARLNPFLFKGILFNTGGYSALYGNALSSALILETVDLPDQSSASLHIFPQSIGAGFQQLGKAQKSSYGVNLNYGNLQWYNHIIPQKPNFFTGPEYLQADANFRIKTGKTGMLKFYTNYGSNRVGMRNPDPDSISLRSSFLTRGTNTYNNLSYRTTIGNHWRVDAVIAYNYNKNTITNQLEDSLHHPLFIPAYPFDQKNNRTVVRSDLAQARTVIAKSFSHGQAFRFGAEYFYSRDKYEYDSIASFTGHHTAVFAEGDIYLARNVATKIGLRAEYASLLNQWVLAPRISFAYRFNDGGQVNAAYGIFYQMPGIEYLNRNRDLDFTRATHYVLNYQKKANNRLLRVEAYYKSYRDLVTTQPVTLNSGDGYAKGIELFFRDKRTIKNLDYWITYTYLDTKRKFLDYPYRIKPDFTTPHTVSVAIKRFFPDINFSANLSYAFATGRPYYNIQTDAGGKPFINDQGKTNTYQNMNLSFAYLFSMFSKWKNKDFSGIGFGISNVLGNNQVYGYRYSDNGLNKLPVSPPATRGYYIGLFMSFGIDRRDDFINENL